MMKTTVMAFIFLTLLSQNTFAQEIPVTTHPGHTSDVNSVVFSPNGTTLASGSDDNTIRLWDVSTGTLKSTLTGNWSDVYSVVFSPDGTTLASGSSDGTIRLWDVSTSTLKSTLRGHWSDVKSVAFSPDGATLASGSDDDTIRLWDVSTSTLKSTLTGHTDYVRSVVFSPDATTLASGSDDRTIRLWDVSTSKHKSTLTGHEYDVRSVAFSPDGTTLASGSLDAIIRLWDVSTSRHKSTLTGHKSTVYSVVFSPDGATLASGSYDRTIRLWDVSTSTHKSTLTGHTFDVRSVVFSPDGATLASGSYDDTIRLWDISSLVNITQVNIVPSLVESPAVGEQFTVNVNIVGGQDIRGYQLAMKYNDNTLRYVSHAPGGYLPGDDVFTGPTINTPSQKEFIADVNGDGVVDNKDIVLVNQGFTTQYTTPAQVSLSATSSAGAGSGDGTLATITFEVVARKASIIILSGYLSNSDGEKSTFNVQYGNVIEPPWDVNGDGFVDILDLSYTAARFGQNEETEADVNGDGVVDIQDLVLVASGIEARAAAPSAYPQAFTMLTAADVQKWLSEAQHLNLTDPTSQRGILFLEQLLASLLPEKTALLANYPNPFNPDTWIPYHLSNHAEVTLTIYGTNGTVVRTLSLGHQTAGMYQSRSRAAHWDGKNKVGEKVSSGVYFYQLQVGNSSYLRKMVILK